VSEAADYYRVGGPVWHRRYRHDSTSDNRTFLTNWHFCFPQGYPTSQLRFYGFGDFGDVPRLIVSAIEQFHKPRTEEFFHGACARNLIDFAHMAIDSVNTDAAATPEVCFIGCDREGRLWCYGASLPNNATNNATRLAGVTPGQSNALGLGRYAPTSVTDQRRNRNICTQVLGEDEDLHGVRFVQTQVHSALRVTSSGTVLGLVSSALDSDGHIWLAGKAAPWAPAAAFPDDTNSELPFFRKLEVRTYVNKYGEEVTDAEPLHFTKFRHRETLLAFTADKRLFMTGTRSPVASTQWFEVGGFVSDAVVVNGGSGYTSLPTVTVSAPGSTYGLTAGVRLQRTGGSITGAKVFLPGRGYGDTPPTVTLSGGGGQDAQIALSLHSGQWEDAASARSTSHCAAVDETGVLYTWGRKFLPNTFSTPTTYEFLLDYPMPVRAYTDSVQIFDRVSVGNTSLGDSGDSFGIALTTEGDAFIYGQVPGAGVTTWHPVPLVNYRAGAAGINFVEADAGQSFVVLLDDTGKAYTMGGTVSSAGRDPATGFGQVEQGEVRMSHVFCGSRSTVFISDREFDSRGNPTTLFPYNGPAN
jgi:hypothetical protein